MLSTLSLINVMNDHSASMGFPPPGPSRHYTQTESPRGRLVDPQRYEYPPLEVPFTNQSAFSSQFTPQGFCYDSPFVYNNAPMNHDNPDPQPQPNQVSPAQGYFEAPQGVYPASASQQNTPAGDSTLRLAQPRDQHRTQPAQQDYGSTWMNPPPMQSIYRKEDKQNEIPFLYPATSLQTGDRFSQLLEAKLGLNRPPPTSEEQFSTPRATYDTHGISQSAQSPSFPSSVEQTNVQRIGIPGPAYHDTLAIETALHDYQQVTISPDDVAPVIPSRYFGWTSRPQSEYQHHPPSFSPMYDVQPMRSIPHYDTSSQDNYAQTAANGPLPLAPAGSVKSGSMSSSPHRSPIVPLAAPASIAPASTLPQPSMLPDTSRTMMHPPPYWYDGSSPMPQYLLPAPSSISSSPRQPPPLAPTISAGTSPPLPGSHSRLSALSPMKMSVVGDTPASASMTNTSMLPRSSSLETTPMVMATSLPALSSKSPWSHDTLSMPPVSATAWTSSPPKASSSASPPIPSRMSPPKADAAESKKRKAVDDESTANKAVKSVTDSGGEGDGERKQVIACYHCRAKKLKCDGGKPRCGNCCRRGETTCAYDATLKRRGPGKNNKKDQRRRATGNVDPKQERSGPASSSSMASNDLDMDGPRLGSRFETSTARGA